jgi:hypothetical protein
VFVSSTLNELEPEREVVREAVERLRLHPVMFELGARPHPPQSLYRAYLEQSHIFIGIYWESYGWVAPGMEVSGLEDECNLCGDRPRLIYVKEPAENRQARLTELLGRIRDDDRASYKRFSTPEQLAELVANDLAILLSERFENVAPFEPAPSTGPVSTGRRRWLLPIGGMLAAGGVVAAIAAVALLTGGDDSGSEPLTDELRVNIPATVQFSETSGDCISSDRVTRGEGSGTTTGDLAGDFSIDVTQTLFAAEQCQSGVVDSHGEITTAPGDILRVQNLLPVNPSVGDPKSGEPIAAEEVGIAIITGGSGRFENAVGTGVCEVSAVRATEGSSTTEGSCVYDMVIYPEDAPVTAQAAASGDELAEGVAVDGSASIYLYFLVRNNSSQVISGLQFGFLNQSEVGLTVVGPGDETVNVEGDWYSGPITLAAGEVGRYQLNVRLLDAGGLESFVLQPTVKGESANNVIQRQELTIEVVR